jgi:hypothetical protein
MMERPVAQVTNRCGYTGGLHAGSFLPVCVFLLSWKQKPRGPDPLEHRWNSFLAGGIK